MTHYLKSTSVMAGLHKILLPTSYSSRKMPPPPSRQETPAGGLLRQKHSPSRRPLNRLARNRSLRRSGFSSWHHERPVQQGFRSISQKQNQQQQLRHQKESAKTREARDMALHLGTEEVASHSAESIASGALNSTKLATLAKTASRHLKSTKVATPGSQQAQQLATGLKQQAAVSTAAGAGVGHAAADPSGLSSFAQVLSTSMEHAAPGLATAQARKLAKAELGKESPFNIASKKPHKPDARRTPVAGKPSFAKGNAFAKSFYEQASHEAESGEYAPSGKTDFDEREDRLFPDKPVASQKKGKGSRYSSRQQLDNTSEGR